MMARNSDFQKVNQYGNSPNNEKLIKLHHD